MSGSGMASACSTRLRYEKADIPALFLVRFPLVAWLVGIRHRLVGFGLRRVHAGRRIVAQVQASLLPAARRKRQEDCHDESEAHARRGIKSRCYQEPQA